MRVYGVLIDSKPLWDSTQAWTEHFHSLLLAGHWILILVSYVSQRILMNILCSPMRLYTLLGGHEMQESAGDLRQRLSQIVHSNAGEINNNLWRTQNRKPVNCSPNPGYYNMYYHYCWSSPSGCCLAHWRPDWLVQAISDTRKQLQFPVHFFSSFCSVWPHFGLIDFYLHLFGWYIHIRAL